MLTWNFGITGLTYYTVKFNKYIKQLSIDYIQSVHLKITIYMTNIKST